MPSTIRPGCAQGHAGSIESPLRERLRKRIRRIAEDSDAKQSGCAHDMGVDPSLISHWGHDCDMPLWRVPAWSNVYGPSLLEWIAIQCGGMFIPHPSFLKQPVTVLIGLLAEQSGATINHLVRDLEDHVWTKEEKAATLPDLRKLRTILDTLIHDAEGGAR